MVIWKVDGDPEKKHNVELLLISLKLPKIIQDFEVVCDLKLIALVVGIHTISCMFGYLYGDCYKIDNL